ncbi:hypothetical protein D3C80_2047270 [compost metagenome]
MKDEARFPRLVNLGISYEDIVNAYKESQLSDDHIQYGAMWTWKCLEFLRSLNSH